MAIRLHGNLIAAFLTLLLACGLGCGKSTHGRGVAKTTIGNRTVTATFEGSGGIGQDSLNRDTAVINISAGSINVEKSAVRFNGDELAKLPENATNVDVTFAAGKLTVTADGNPIVTKNIGE